MIRCQKPDGCRSPLACGGFAYCRERNWADGAPVTPSDATRRAWELEDNEEKPDV